MTDFVQLHPCHVKDLKSIDDPILEGLTNEPQGLGLADGAAPVPGEPFDLRVLRPRAIDLRELWKITNQDVPKEIAAALGPRIPILLNHVVTPFPLPGKAPGRVWGLGYEFEPQDLNANTVSVVPSDEVLQIGKVGQDVDFGIELGGKIALPKGVLATIGPELPLTNASLHASTNQSFQFSLQLKVTLRKVVGAGFNAGGAKWNLYRQDEAIDGPYALMQTLLVPEGTKSFKCTIRTWAKQAGFLGTGLGAKFWTYPDHTFEIPLTA